MEQQKQTESKEALFARIVKRFGVEADIQEKLALVPVETLAVIAGTPEDSSGKDWKVKYSLYCSEEEVVVDSPYTIMALCVYVLMWQSDTGVQRNQHSGGMVEGTLWCERADATFYIHRAEQNYVLHSKRRNCYSVEGTGHVTTTMPVGGTYLSVKAFGAAKVSYYSWDHLEDGNHCTAERAVVELTDTSKDAWWIESEKSVGPNGREERYEVYRWDVENKSPYHCQLDGLLDMYYGDGKLHIDSMQEDYGDGWYAAAQVFLDLVAREHGE